MHSKGLTAHLIAGFLLLSTLSSTALASATLSGGNLLVPIADAREVIADSAALLAENGALKQALAEERAAGKALMEKMEAYISSSEEEKGLLKEQNRLLNEQLKMERRRTAAAERKAFFNLLLGAAVGYGVSRIID